MQNVLTINWAPLGTCINVANRCSHVSNMPKPDVLSLEPWTCCMTKPVARCLFLTLPNLMFHFSVDANLMQLYFVFCSIQKSYKNLIDVQLLQTWYILHLFVCPPVNLSSGFSKLLYQKNQHKFSGLAVEWCVLLMCLELLIVCCRFVDDGSASAWFEKMVELQLV